MPKIAYIICAVAIVAILISSFLDLYDYTLIIFDDCEYPKEVRNLLKHGEHHWAGSKPGVVMLAALCGVTSPIGIMYFYAVIGLLSGAGLFFLADVLFKQWMLALSGALLWLSSPFYFYYAKTHLIVYVACYLWGLGLCYQGIITENRKYYFWGCFLLGWGLLSYYVLLVYLPFVLMSFLYFFLKRKRSLRQFIVETAIPFLLPITAHDLLSVIAYFIWHKKNSLFCLSVFRQLWLLPHTNIPYGIWHYPNIFLQAEWVSISLLFIVSLMIIFKDLLKLFLIQEKDLEPIFLISLFLPALFLIVRGYCGAFSTLRTFAAMLPIIYLIALYPIKRYVPIRYMALLLALVSFSSIGRLYAIHTRFAPTLKSSYSTVAEYLDAKADLIVHMGPHVWEAFFDDKDMIGLNMRDDPYWSINNELARAAITTKINTSIEQGRRVVLVIAGCDNGGSIEHALHDNFCLTLKKEFYDPHNIADFVIEESNSQGENFRELVKKTTISMIKVYDLTKKA